MDEKEPILPEAKPESRLHKAMRGALRWTLVALLAFGLGAILIVFALYVPTRQKLDKANADLEDAHATITGNTDQITTLQTSNKTLQKNLDSATLHMVVLKALSGVRGASLAVAADDYAGARLSLTQASVALDTLSNLLGTDQKDVLTAMQKSAAQALTDIKTDLKSAQPELDQLTKNLVQLEDNLFPNP
jgi:septal ring factor EnvC (AmiA/AmiB activator)